MRQMSERIFARRTRIAAAVSAHPSNADASLCVIQRVTMSSSVARRCARSATASRHVRNALCALDRAMRTAKSIALSRAANRYNVVVAHSENAACRSRRRHLSSVAFALARATRVVRAASRQRSKARVVDVKLHRRKTRRAKSLARRRFDARAPLSAVHAAKL